MVQGDELVFDWNVCRKQMRDGGDDAAGRKVASPVIVAADNQDARMRASGRSNELMQLVEIVVVSG
jgi:hypothetical protein